MGCLARMICRLCICGRMASCTAESAGVQCPIRRIMRCAGKELMPTAMSVASVPKEKFTTTDKQEDPGLRYAAWGPSFFFNEEMWRGLVLFARGFSAGWLRSRAHAGSVRFHCFLQQLVLSDVVANKQGSRTLHRLQEEPACGTALAKRN